MKKELKIKNALSKDFQQIYIEDKPTNLFINEDGRIKTKSIKDDASDGSLVISSDAKFLINSSGILELASDTHTAIALSDGANKPFRMTNGLNTVCGFSAESGAESTFEMFEAGGDSSNDFFSIRVLENGETELKTTDAAAEDAVLTMNIDGDLRLDSAGEIFLDHTNRMKWKKSGTVYAQMDVATTSNLTLFEQGGASTADFLQLECATNGESKIVTYDNSATAAHLTVDADGDITLDAASGNIYCKDNGGNYTPGSDYEIATKKYVDDNAGGGTSRWSFSTGGYKTNNNSSSFYYFAYRPNGENWSNSDSSPTTLNIYDASSCSWIAPAAGTVTNITVQGYVNDTGSTDPFKFYVFKGQSAHDATTTSLTQIGVTGTITPAAALRNFRISTDISSSNSFSDHDGIWVMYKKDSTTANQDLYFSVTISGEYS